jgi:hypothetical protein
MQTRLGTVLLMAFPMAFVRRSYLSNTFVNGLLSDVTLANGQPDPLVAVGI